MSKDSSCAGSNIIPALRYIDAPAAIDWLCKAFGFESKMVVPGESNTVLHAQLTYAGGMIMLGSKRDNDLEPYMRTPSELGGLGTGSLYVVVDDADAHFERAKRAGAKIVMEVEEQEHRGRLYSCLDPEGYLWNFGTYDPWQAVEGS